MTIFGKKEKKDVLVGELTLSLIELQTGKMKEGNHAFDTSINY